MYVSAALWKMLVELLHCSVIALGLRAARLLQCFAELGFSSCNLTAPQLRLGLLGGAHDYFLVDLPLWPFLARFLEADSLTSLPDLVWLMSLPSPLP